ncbi:oxaloacetate decarboxylase subunit alpha [Phycisphaerales bacterium AB-hyl4]|uniref:Oxaloacetate decarboxylase subunit alpha n=1 Tax=Natronomicrosphaera hydrolytica TaxID=3242702 RepID=A0ABV4U9C2_9BACT
MSKSINFIDCSLRDGHQSLLATRMSTEQCMRVLPLLKDTGYNILELWGGATLDACLRFTNDDPWERLDRFRQTLGPDIQIRSLCRGQNLFGYTPYADNVVFEFIKEAVKSGNDRIRIFDALNDARNLQTAIMATKTFNGHAEAAMSYTTSPVHDLDHFLRFAQTVLDNGADSLAIKDMAGLLHPADCIELVQALRERFGDVTITLHSHCTNGLATTAYIAGMLAGVDHLDTCHGPMAGGTSQPSVELLNEAAKIAGYETNVDLRLADKIDAELRKIRKELHDADRDPEHFGNPWPATIADDVKHKLATVVELVQSRDRDKIEQAIAIVEDEILVPQGFAPVDRNQLDAQVPGGMISNLHKQLKDQDKLDQLPQILAEIPKVRAEAGYVPLVTPTSQIVGTQAAMNIITGNRYGMATNEFRSMVLGKYGRLPGKASPEVIRKCSPDGKTFSERPANYAPKVDLAKTIEEVGPLLKSHRDLLLYLLFPAPSKAFFGQRKAETVV